MSAPFNDGGAAFPGLHPSDECRYKDSGMTLRDYFAAQALAGMMARKESDGWTNREVAGDCYSLADAMISARESIAHDRAAIDAEMKAMTTAPLDDFQNDNSYDLQDNNP